MKIKSANFVQGKIEEILIETCIRPGFPSFEIIGIKNGDSKGCKEKIRAIMRNAGFSFPKETLAVNLIPNDSNKNLTLLNLAITLSIIFAKNKSNKTIWAFGELSLFGEGISIEDFNRIKKLSELNKNELFILTNSNIKAKNIISVKNLNEAVEAIIKYLEEDDSTLNSQKTENTQKDFLNNEYYKNPFTRIIGLEYQKEILRISIAGGLNTLLFGPKGAGKTLLLSRTKYLLSQRNGKTNNLSWEYLKTPKELRDNTLVLQKNSMPKELITIEENNEQNILLANNGAVVLDELTEFNPKTLNALKEIIDSNGKTNLLKGMECKFFVIASMNACKCTKLGLSNESCSCSPKSIEAYWNIISPSFLSRFDIFLPVVPEGSYCLTHQQVVDEKNKRIEKAYSRQMKRQGFLNGELSKGMANEKTIEIALKTFTSSDCREALKKYSIALTIADLNDRNIEEEDILTANILCTSTPWKYFHKLI